MQSLLDYIADGEDISVWSAWVDLVHVDWPESEGGAKELEKDDGYPPIEGITTYHVGFQRVPIMDLYPECWRSLDLMSWKYYWRPPKRSHNDDSMDDDLEPWPV